MMLPPRQASAPAACLAFVLLLQACAPVVDRGDEPAPPAARPDRTVELNLNLPEPDNCNCQSDQEPVDYTFLDRGMQALARGEYIEAVQQFQRYRRLEKADTARWEATLAIAYASMLPRSPFYDADAALASFKQLQRSYREDMQLHDSIALLYAALDAFLQQATHLSDLKNSNALLKADLEKREQALKRLRELALGQREARP
ncbi:MAG: hypothetical protein ABR578_04585 [Chromatocurvus sp.]